MVMDVLCSARMRRRLMIAFELHHVTHVAHGLSLKER